MLTRRIVPPRSLIGVTCAAPSFSVANAFELYGLLGIRGADPYRFDQLGGLGLTLEGLRRRDEVVFKRATDAGAAVAVCLAGGYAVRPEDTVEIHCNTVRAAESQ